MGSWGDGIGVSLGLGWGFWHQLGLGWGCWQSACSHPSRPQSARGMEQPRGSLSRLLFLISFVFSSVPNELGRGELGLVSEELVLGHARAVQGWPFPGPALRHRTGWEGAELGVSGQEAPQEGMSCRQTKREKIGGHWHAPQGTHVQTRQ